LIHLINTLNDRHQYGLKLVLLSIDEGIVGYRDDSLKTVHRNSAFYGLPLHILSYKDIYGWSMDEIVKVIGTKNNCTFCGVFRRQALDRGAALVGATKIVTGHNADDTAETILMNILRADAPRLSRCVSTTTGSEGLIPRVKPLKYAYEKEIVLYAHFKKLDYFTTECTYSKEAFRGNARTLLKELERLRPRVIADVLYSGEHLPLDPTSTAPAGAQRHCAKCGYISSQNVCRACVLLESLRCARPEGGLK
jgi:cytoplasmic tRNA 2-thiolation protein 1